MKIFLTAIIVHLFLSPYVCWRGWQILPQYKLMRIPYICFFGLELLIYLIGFIASTALPVNILHPITLIGTSWFVFIGYMAALLLTYDLAHYLSLKISKLSGKINFRSSRLKRYFFFFSFFFVLVFMVNGSYRFWNPTVSKLDLTINKQTPNVDSLKVVFVADIHVGYIIDRNILRMYVDRIMEQKPDLILIGGDIIDYDLPPLEAQDMGAEFRRLKAPYGVFATTGNHEYRLNAEDKIRWLTEKAGLTVLRDSVVKIADSFYIVGREDDLAPKRLPLDQIVTQANLDKSLPMIVVNHEPNRLYEESDVKADLALYGHTHNGQLFPANIYINLRYELGYGYKKKEDTHMYVTSGLGLSGPQYRIGTISEIVVLNLKFQK